MQRLPCTLPWPLLTAPGCAQGCGCHLHPAAGTGRLLELAAGHLPDKRVHSCQSVLLAGHRWTWRGAAGPGPRPHRSPLSTFHNTTRQPGQIGMALSQGLWSSDEGNSLGSVMQELKNPQVSP